jgi:hypothetical protein
MKRNLLTSVWAGLMLGAAGIMTAQASSTLITFSVDESSNLVNGTFNPSAPANVGGTPYGGTGTNQVYARGTFNGWGAYLPLVQAGSGPVYTNTVDDTSDANGGNLSYIYHDDVNGDEGPADWANRTAYLPTNSGASLVLPTPFFNDIGPATTANVKFQVDMSQQINFGQFHPHSGDTVVIAGSFQGWNISAGAPWVLTNDPSILVTNNNFSPPVIESNVYTATEAITLNARYSGKATINCAEDFKYVIMPEANWDSPSYPNADSGGNRFFTEGNQTLPLVNFNDAPYTSAANVTLNVDMSGVIRYDTNYVPNSVTVWGTFNGWSSGIPMTSNPAPNTNIFSSTAITMPEGVANIIQVRYTNSLVAANNPTAAWVYDYVNDSVLNNNARRTITLPVTTTTLNTNAPSFYFLDLALDDYLPKATPVLFSVNMNGAVATNGYVFNPSSDSVYINGMFANGGGTPYPQTWYPWSGGINPVSAPPGYQMIREGSTTIYTNTIIILAGTPVALSYQYGMDPSSLNGGPLEDEAPSGANHFRVVRSTAVNLYTMPADAFTNQPYQEPLFAPGNIYEGMGTLAGGNLTVGTPVAGAIPVSWLGRPGAHLQSATSVNGPWADIWATDGTNWTSGVNTTNGLMSVTNRLAASGTTFFRLVKP